MTPQERQLVAELFDRLAQLENNPRDPDAEDLIADLWDKAPNAAYALLQTVLVQDEALKRANDHIQELKAELGIEPEQPQQGGGFLRLAQRIQHGVKANALYRGIVPGRSGFHGIGCGSE
jgi:hypothetical protein